MENLEKNLYELIQLDEEIQNYFNREDKENSEDLVTQFSNAEKFSEIKLKVKAEFTRNSTIIISDRKARELLNKINSNTKFFAETILEVLNTVSDEKINFDDITKTEDIDELISDEFYSWYTPYCYIRGLVEIGVLISGVSTPVELDSFVDEARKCYTFKQYNAVYSLCRTILETAMRDIGVRKGNIIPPENDIDFYNEYPPRKLINHVSTGGLNKKIHNLYTELSSLIHGYKMIKPSNAKNTLKETLLIVQELYNKNIKE